VHPVPSMLDSLPDSAIPVADGKRQHTDLMHCKGCGICAAICPVHCIDMKLESEIKPESRRGDCRFRTRIPGYSGFRRRP